MTLPRQSEPMGLSAEADQSMPFIVPFIPSIMTRPPLKLCREKRNVPYLQSAAIANL
jgi:hypothetical protein